MNKIRLIMVMSLLLAACSTKIISTAPEMSLKLIADTVVVSVTGPDVDAKVLDQLMREIRGQLIIAGFEVDNLNAVIFRNIF